MSEDPGPPIWVDAEDIAWLERLAQEAGHGDPGRVAGEMIHEMRLAAEREAARRADPWAEPLAELRRRRNGQT